ncbi:MAG: TolC family protein [Verrucomicrobiae bacterium]|nr:TolC family protein [Verrucomicrobiae bacterium]
MHKFNFGYNTSIQHCFSLALLSVAFLAGCTSDTAYTGTLRDSVNPGVPKSHPPYQNRSEEKEWIDPVGQLSLNQVISLSVERNPELQAFALDVQGAHAHIRQARLWSNPELEFEIENFGGSGSMSGSDSAEKTLSLAQHLPLGGDVGRRKELAELQMELSDWEFHAARLQVIVEATQRFVEALAAERRLTLAKQELDLAETTESIAKGRVEAGDASPLELTRVIVPVIEAELEMAKAKRNREAAYHRLSLIWGARTLTFSSVQGDLNLLAPVPNPQDLAAYINGNPEVARWTTEISARIAEGRLAKAKALPDLTGRIGFRRFNETNDDALVLGISLPLPIFDRNQGEILASRLGEASARRRKEAAELRLESILNSTYTELLAAQEEAVALRERAIPTANEAYEATLIAFQEGKLPFLDVLDAQRTYFDLQHRYLEALVAYHSNVAEIEALIGQRITKI